MDLVDLTTIPPNTTITPAETLNPQGPIKEHRLDSFYLFVVHRGIYI